MVSETPKQTLSPLLPDRYPQPDLFICDVADAILKDVMQHMEHPFYSLSKKPQTRVRRYEHNGHWLEITPSVKGQATIYDKDILIYCISQIMAKLKNGEEVTTPRIRINSHELLKFSNRGTAGKDYAALSEAIDRLAGTRITTNIKTGDEEQYDNFGLIDAASIRRKNGLDGRLLWCEIKVSDWVFNAIRHNEVLTLHPDYFRLRKPLERRVYELARKHCGKQKQWKISLETLIKKSGSQSKIKRFRQMLKGLIDTNHLPDYSVAMDDEDMVAFTRKDGGGAESRQGDLIFDDLPQISRQTLETGRWLVNQAGTGWDFDELHRQFTHSVMEGFKPENVNAAFIGFVKSKIVQCP
jgi:plasmid replication initiation protein